MAHEEQEVLPLLEAHLCAAEQRAMVWRTLRAMPLRLLERVMPWVAGQSYIPFIAYAKYWQHRLAAVVFSRCLTALFEKLSY